MKNLVFVLLLFISNVVFPQGEIDNENRALFRNESTVNLLLNSNGWGFGYTFGKMDNISRKTLWNVEWVKIKDPKEYKQNAVYPDFRRFVYGKQNEFYNLRFNFGNLISLYQKKDKGGIEVRCFYFVGINAGLLKPVYYITQLDSIGEAAKYEKFSNANLTNIYGGAPFYKGLSELKFVPGIHSKIGASFEFSNRDLVINAVEGGIGIDLYPKVVKIMENNENNFYFLSLFIGYRFGRIINPRAVKPKIENESL